MKNPTTLIVCVSDTCLQVHGFYNWPRIAARTEKVYAAAVSSKRDDEMMGRFCRYYKCGAWFGKICCCLAAAMHLYWCWLEILYPRAIIDIAIDFSKGSLDEKETEHPGSG